MSSDAGTPAADVDEDVGFVPPAEFELPQAAARRLLKLLVEQADRLRDQQAS